MLTRLPGSKWWIETNDDGEIVGTYNKAQITADIKSIKETLGEDSSSKEEKEISKLVKNNEDSKELIEKMVVAYEGSREFMEKLELEMKLEKLITLRERLI